MCLSPLRLIFPCYLWLLFVVSGCEEADRSPERPPNVLLIFIDDLGWRDVGFNGGTWYDTPHLDRLAGESMVFSHGYASASNCAPSRACMLSGRYSPRHGVYTVNNSDRGKAAFRRLIPTPNIIDLADSLYTLAELFRDHGYVTCSVGKWHVGDDPRSQGFHKNVAGDHRGHPNGYFSPYELTHLKDGPKGEYLTDRLTDESIAFMAANRASSFFLYLPYYTVHTPLQGKEYLIEKYLQRKGITGERQATYGAMVEAMDANVGRLMQALDSLGLRENTLVIFTSDNGGISALSSQAPLRAGKGSYYEGGIRVPLLFRLPGRIPAGVRTETPVANLDFFPSFQTLLGDSQDLPLDGVDLTPLLFEQDTLPARSLFWHFPIYLQGYRPGHDGGRDPLFRTRPGSVIRDGKWKLHEYFEDGGIELYNLEDDPGEIRNVAGDYPHITDSLYQQLVDWRQQTGAPVPTEKNPDYDPAVEREAILEATAIE